MSLTKEGARIYNLFPRLAGKMDNWKAHFERIQDLGFEWVYVNPFHYPGFSGSLYAPKDYYEFNPIFINPSSNLPPMKQLENVIEDAHKLGLRMIMDLVINHTAKDHPYTKLYPEWYKKNEKGEIISPGAWDNGHWVEWGDLAEIDNENAESRQKLWDYWKELLLFYQEKGFDGFRADAAYAVPSELWKYLIGAARQKNPDVVFFAESLGCPLEQTLMLAESGFDYIFNSSKWWNYSDSWLLDQYQKTREAALSVSFPESHDTLRLSTESNGNLKLIKQRTAFTAFFSSGWMIPVGFEYGFRRKMDVSKTYPEDWEKINYDLTGFIQKINDTRKKFPIFNEESEIDLLDNPAQSQVLIFQKTSKNGKEKVLFLLNKSSESPQTVSLGSLKQLLKLNKKAMIQNISIENSSAIVDIDDFEAILEPYDVRIYIIR